MKKSKNNITRHDLLIYKDNNFLSVFAVDCVIKEKSILVGWLRIHNLRQSEIYLDSELGYKYKVQFDEEYLNTLPSSQFNVPLKLV